MSKSHAARESVESPKLVLVATIPLSRCAVHAHGRKQPVNVDETLQASGLDRDEAARGRLVAVRLWEVWVDAHSGTLCTRGLQPARHTCRCHPDCRYVLSCANLHNAHLQWCLTRLPDATGCLMFE
eukprot:UN1065